MPAAHAFMGSSCLVCGMPAKAGPQATVRINAPAAGPMPAYALQSRYPTGSGRFSTLPRSTTFIQVSTVKMDPGFRRGGASLVREWTWCLGVPGARAGAGFVVQIFLAALTLRPSTAPFGRARDEEHFLCTVALNTDSRSAIPRRDRA